MPLPTDLQRIADLLPYPKQTETSWEHLDGWSLEITPQPVHSRIEFKNDGKHVAYIGIRRWTWNGTQWVEV